MSFVHLPKLLDLDLQTVYINGRRFYVAPTGEKYPSITTVLGANPEKLKSLAEWRARVGKSEANKISKQSSSRGTRAHKICEKYVDNDPDYMDGAMPDAKAMFLSLKPTLDASVDNVRAQELPLITHRLGTAGRVDLIADWDKVPSIIDYKTSAKPKHKKWIADYFMQGAGYAAMYYEMYNFVIKDIVVAIMVAGQTEPQIFKEKVMDWLPGLKSSIDYFNKRFPNG